MSPFEDVTYRLSALVVLQSRGQRLGIVIRIVSGAELALVNRSHGRFKRFLVIRLSYFFEGRLKL